MSTTFDVILNDRRRRRASLIEFWCSLRDCFSAPTSNGMTNKFAQVKNSGSPQKEKEKNKSQALQLRRII